MPAEIVVVKRNIDSFKPALGTASGLTYNKANRLETVSDKTKRLGQYTYDAFGQRFIKNTFGDTKPAWKS